MVDIRIAGDDVIIEILGLHIIWTLKKQVVLKKRNIKAITLADRSLRPPSIRCPGTYIPGIIAAGTYRGKNRKEFWDTLFKGNAIAIEMNNDAFTKVVVDVTNPEETIRELT